MARNAPRLSLPGKLVFPSTHNSGHFSMLGLGDIVMPGLLLCFVMRYDAYKRAQVFYLFIKVNLYIFSLQYSPGYSTFPLPNISLSSQLNKIFRTFKLI